MASRLTVERRAKVEIEVMDVLGSDAESSAERLVMLSPYDLDSSERDEEAKKSLELYLVMKGNGRRKATLV